LGMLEANTTSKPKSPERPKPVCLRKIRRFITPFDTQQIYILTLHMKNKHYFSLTVKIINKK